MTVRLEQHERRGMQKLPGPLNHRQKGSRDGLILLRRMSKRQVAWDILLFCSPNLLALNISFSFFPHEHS